MDAVGRRTTPSVVHRVLVMKEGRLFVRVSEGYGARRTAGVVATASVSPLSDRYAGPYLVYRIPSEVSSCSGMNRARQTGSSRRIWWKLSIS